MKLRVVRGQDTSQQGTARHAKLSKWDKAFHAAAAERSGGAELDLTGCESLDHHHKSAAFGAKPKRAPILDRGCLWFGLQSGRVECCEAQRQKLSSAAVGEEPEVADADKAPGEQMQEEAAQELIER